MSENTRGEPHRFPDANWINFRTSSARTLGLQRWAGVFGPTGGARRDRTDDLLLAKQALSQLSYGPSTNQQTGIGNQEAFLLTPGA